MNKHIIHTYYSVLGITALSMVLFTIFTGSKTVSYGQTIAELEKQKQVLVEQESHIRQQIAAESSLSQVQQLAQVDGYVLTTQLVQLPTQTQVALR